MDFDKGVSAGSSSPLRSGYRAAMDRYIARSHERSLDTHGSSTAAWRPGGDAQEQRASK